MPLPSCRGSNISAVFLATTAASSGNLLFARTFLTHSLLIAPEVVQRAAHLGDQVARQLRAQRLLARHQVRHGHGGDLHQTPHQDLLADVEEDLGGEPVVEHQPERLPGARGRLEVALLLEYDPDLEVNEVSAGLHLGPVLQVPAGDHLEPLLVLRLVLQPAEDDLHDLVSVCLVLE